MVDSGPLIALFDRDDAHYTRVVSFLEGFKGQLVTTWPVLTEVSHLLDFSVKAQIDFLTWIDRGGLRVENLNMEDIRTLAQFMAKYHDRPMDLADASLLLLAQKERIHSIVTLDRDFSVYCLPPKKTLKNLLD